MFTSINWGRLYEQGRCKDVGVPWSEAEAQARAKGVPVDYIRKGILTIEAYKAAEKAEREAEAGEDTVPIDRLKKDRLIDLAQAVGISLDPSIVTKETLLRELKAAGVSERVPKD